MARFRLISTDNKDTDESLIGTEYEYIRGETYTGVRNICYISKSSRGFRINTRNFNIFWFPFECFELIDGEFDEELEFNNITDSFSPTHSILTEAKSIVNGDRNEQYGDAKEAFTIYSDICKTNFGINVSPSDVCKVLMAVKLGRLKYKYKRDSLVDLCGYAEILSRLEEE